MATRQFDLEEFVTNPTHEELINIRKVDWVEIAKHYNIGYTTTMRKEELKNVVVENLVDQQILPEIALQTLTPAGLPPEEGTPETSPSPLPTGVTVVLDADRLYELEKIKLEIER